MLTRTSQTFPLVKYSFNQGTVSSATSFTHISDKNLCLAIDDSAEPPGSTRKTCFRIILRSDILETVHVQKLAEEATGIMQESQMHLYTKNHLPIWGVAKGQTIALQHTASTGQMKRMQIRFSCDPDAETVLGILQAMGVQMEHRGLSANANTAPSLAQSGGSPTRSGGLHAQPIGIGTIGRPQTSHAPTTTDTFGPLPNDQRPQTTTNRPLSPGEFRRPQSGLAEPPTTTETQPQWPSESVSRILPPVRTLPPGFPSRPSSASESVQGNQSRPQSLTQAVQSRPTTRSRSNVMPITGKSPQQNAVNETSEPYPRTTWQLNTAVRLEPPPVPANYRFNAPITAPSPPTSSPSPGIASPSPVSHAGRITDLPQYPALMGNLSAMPRLGDPQGLAEYAAQPDHERAAALNRFICDNLQSDEFLRLCEDVDACWRRIGLGM